jgi:tetratricopeptide (TPR) repeat protein
VGYDENIAGQLFHAGIKALGLTDLEAVARWRAITQSKVSKRTVRERYKKLKLKEVSIAAGVLRVVDPAWFDQNGPVDEASIKADFARRVLSPDKNPDSRNKLLTAFTNDIIISCAVDDVEWAEWISWTLNAGGYDSRISIFSKDAIDSTDSTFTKGNGLLIGLVSSYTFTTECSQIWDGFQKVSEETGKQTLLLVKILSLDGQNLPSSLRLTPFVDLQGLDQQTAGGVVQLGVREVLGLCSSIPKSIQSIDLPPPFPGAIRKLHNLRLSRNRNFVGRSLELENLKKRLESGSPTALTQAAHGLGGVGKTQLANEYAYRWQDSYQVVWWIRSEDESTLTTDLIDLAHALNLPFNTSQQGISILKQWLLEHGDWLLVFDNVESPENIQNYLVPNAQGHTIITSRHSAWRGVADSLNVTTFERPDSIAYLQKRTGITETKGAGDLADALGDLPLALAQAAAYIEQSGLNFAAYLDLFRDHQEHLLRINPPKEDGGYSHTVATTWDISFKKLAETSTAAQEVLSILAYFSPDAIPKAIIAVAPNVLPEPVKQVVENRFLLQEIWRAMHQLSLVEAGPETVTIHRLVQEVIFLSHSHEEQGQYANIALELSVAAITYEENSKETWNRSLPFLPHAVAAAKRALRSGHQAEKAVNLLDNVASIHWKLGQITESEDLCRQALTYSEKHLDENSSTLGTVCNNLGSLLRMSDRSEEALPLLEKAVEIGLQTLGENAPKVAIRYGNLGLALRRLERLQEAEKNFRRALEIDRKHYGEKDDAVARDLCNLSRSLSAQGPERFKEACECLESAIEIGEAYYKKPHSRIAIRHNNLAMLLKNNGDLKQAEHHIRRAIEIDEEYFHSEHQDVAEDLCNLAEILSARDELNKAEQALVRALEIFHSTLGTSNSLTKKCQKDLSKVRVAQGRREVKQ